MEHSVRGLRARFGGDGRLSLLLAVALGWLFILGSRFLVPAVLPQVKDAFGVGNTGGGVAVTVIWATYALMQSPAGLLADRLGERRLLVGSLLLTAGSVIALGLAPAFLAFLGGCAGFGVATGFYGPARGMVLSRTFPRDDGAAIGVTLAAGSAGSATLPLLAGVLVGSVGWRSVVAGLCPPLALAGLFAWWAVPERGDEEGGDPPRSLRALAGDVVRAFGVQGVPVAVVGMTLMLFAFQGLTAFWVTYLVTERPLAQGVAAGLFAVLFVGAAVAQVLGGAVADRVGERVVLVATAAVGAVSLAVVPAVEGLVPLAALSAVLGTRLGVAPVTNAYVIDRLPDGVTGTVWGLLRTAFFLVGAAGSTVVGVLADRGHFDGAFLLLAGLTAVAGVLYLLLPSRR
jgi:MFS family permease